MVAEVVERIDKDNQTSISTRPESTKSVLDPNLFYHPSLTTTSQSQQGIFTNLETFDFV